MGILLSSLISKELSMNKIVLGLAAFSCLFSSCARNISSNVYSANSVGEASKTYKGVIISTRQVTVEEHERLEENGLGIVGGGIGGAVVGSQIGKGSGNTLALIGGAIAGATAGAFAEKALKSQDATEYVVALDNGDAMTVVQAIEPVLTEGQRVFVIVSHEGRSRLVANNSAAA